MNFDELITNYQMAFDKKVGERFELTELVEVVNSIIGNNKFGLNLSETDFTQCLVNGKTESPNEIYDDHFSFNLELNWGDLYLDLYFIRTNEDLYYLTEVAIDYDAWKVNELKHNVEMCGLKWDEIIEYRELTKDENRYDGPYKSEDDWFVGKFTEGDLWMNNCHGYMVLITPPDDMHDTRYFCRYF